MEGLWRFICSYSSVAHLILRGQLPQTRTLSIYFLFSPALFLWVWILTFEVVISMEDVQSSPSTYCKAICLLLWFIMIRSHQTGDKLINCRCKWCEVLVLFSGAVVAVCFVLCGVSLFFWFPSFAKCIFLLNFTSCSRSLLVSDDLFTHWPSNKTELFLLAFIAWNKKTGLAIQGRYRGIRNISKAN